jgi:ribose transport system substrate-binding protein
VSTRPRHNISEILTGFAQFGYRPLQPCVYSSSELPGRFAIRSTQLGMALTSTRRKALHGRIALAASVLVAIGAGLGWARYTAAAASRIAFIPRTTGSTLWEAEHAGAASAASRWNFEVYWNAPTHEDDVEDQIALVDRIRRGGFGGLVLAPDHSLALLTPVQKVIAAGIPVIIVSSPLALPPGKNLSYIINDDEEAGQIAARRIGCILGGRGTVAILGLDPDVTGILIRLQAFEKYLNAHYPAVRVMSRGPGAFNAAEAQQATLSALSSAGHLSAIVSLTAVSTRAAFFTLKGTNQLKTIKLVGFEQDGDMTERVRQGLIDSIVSEDTYTMGFDAVQELAARRAGKPVPARTVLKPLLVTKENANSPELRRFTNMVWFDEK